MVKHTWGSQILVLTKFSFFFFILLRCCFVLWCSVTLVIHPTVTLPWSFFLLTCWVSLSQKRKQKHWVHMKWFIFLSELWIVSQVLTLKKLPLLSVRPLGGFPSGVLEAMLSSCPQDRPTLTSGVCLRLGRCQQRPELCGSKTHFSAVVQPEEIPALATAGVMEVLVCWNAFSVSQFLLSPLAFYTFSSPSPLTLLPPLSSSRLSSPLHLR